MGFLKKLERKVLRPIGRAVKKAVSWVTGLQDFDINDFNQGALVNKQSNVEPIPIIYGERKVGGKRSFVATSGADNTYLYVVLVLCEGEINAIGDVYINEIISTDTRFTGKVTINKYVGTDSQTADSMLTSANVGWTSDHRLRGIAYLAMRFAYDQDTFGGGVPNVTCIVQGKKCFDPRTSTTIYTRNPAVCLRDYLTNARYGKGLTAGLIDDASFIVAANKCDASVSKYIGASGTEPIFRLNTIINTGETLFNNVKVFLASMRGIFPFSDGKYSLVIEDDYSPTFDFNLRNIMSDISVTSIPKSQQYNRVTAKFTNPLANWQGDSVTWPLAGSAEYTQYLADDNGIELVGEINIPGTTDIYAARDLARIVCLDSRLAKLSVEFAATTDAMKCAIGDVVTLTHESMGWNLKRFRVTSLVLADTGEVFVTLKEHIAAIYPWVVNSEADAFAASNLPNLLAVAPPTSFVITETTYLEKDGTVVPEIEVRWTPSIDKFVEQYEFQWKLAAATDYNSTLTIEPRVDAKNLEVGSTFNIRARAINSIGVRSAWLSTTYTIVGDIVGPEKATGLSLIGDVTRAEVSWDACEAKDYKETLVWASVTDVFADAEIQARVAGTTITYSGLPENTTYYVWVQHVDFSNNLGEMSVREIFSTSRGNISPPTSLSITQAPIIAPDGTVVPFITISWTAPAQLAEYYELEFKETALTPWQSVSVTTTSYQTTGAKIGVAYSIRVRAVNSNFGKSAYLTGSYTPSGDVTAPEQPTGLNAYGSYNEATLTWTACVAADYKETIVYAGTSATFSGATPISARIAGNVVTYYNLAKDTTYYVWLKHVDFTGNESALSARLSFNTTTGVTTLQLADGAVTEPKIGTNAVTEPKINTNAVTSTKIANGAVTNAKLDANAVAANVFAAGIQPIGIVASVPLTKSVDTIFNTADAKLYRWNGTAYVKTVDNNDIVSIQADKITAGTINAAITTTNILQLSTNGKIYTAGKTSAASTTPGVFLGHDGGSSYDFAVGDASKSIIYDGSSGSFTFTNVDIETTGRMVATGGETVAGVLSAIHGIAGAFGGHGVYASQGTFGSAAIRAECTTSWGLLATSTTGLAVEGRATSSTGIGVEAENTAGGRALNVPQGNVTIGAATNTGASNLILGNGSAGARLNDQMIILAQDSGGAKTTMHLIVEEDVVAGTGPLAGITNQLKIRINGVEYWLPIVPV
jgi:predicted phage tail protein